MFLRRYIAVFLYLYRLASKARHKATTRNYVSHGGALNNRRTFRPELIQWLGLFRNMRRFSGVCAI